MRIQFALFSLFVGLNACSSASSSASTSCSDLAACCPASGAESSCNLTVKTGNDAQCASTLAAFQDSQKCPKAAWSCVSTVTGNVPLPMCADFPKTTNFPVCENQPSKSSVVPDGCKKDGILGRCTLAAEGSSVPVVFAYYDDGGPATDPPKSEVAKNDCTGRGGTWK